MEGGDWMTREARRQYQRAWAQARHRQEEWAFEPYTWWRVWFESGVTAHRGAHAHLYCMTRVDPLEAWGPHNSIIVSRRQLFHKLSRNLHRREQIEWSWSDAVHI